MRSRILAFGAAGLLVIAGALSAVLVDGLTGQVLAIVLITAGLGAVVLLLFLEVGLSEDHAREREEEERGQPVAQVRRRSRLRRPPRRRG
jgi:hypothetical protein